MQQLPGIHGAILLLPKYFFFSSSVKWGFPIEIWHCVCRLSICIDFHRLHLVATAALRIVLYRPLHWHQNTERCLVFLELVHPLIFLERVNLFFNSCHLTQAPRYKGILFLFLFCVKYSVYCRGV